jgi:hypothetical protein
MEVVEVEEVLVVEQVQMVEVLVGEEVFLALMEQLTLEEVEVVVLITTMELVIMVVLV